MRSYWLRPLMALIASMFLGSASPGAPESALDVAGIAQAAGRAGVVLPGGVYRIGFPRTDLHVSIAGVKVSPGLGLSGYAAFTQEPNTTLALGDLVLREGEIQRVMTSLENSGFHITALHNHLRNEVPHVMYMHFMGTGDAKALAAGLRAALLLTGTPLAITKPADVTVPWFASSIQDGLGRKGTAANGILSVSVPRAEDVTMQGFSVPPAMGVAIAMNFEGVRSDRVATTGDFVLLASEVSIVEHSLLAHGFEITALHHHMVGDSPQLYYMHFWSVQAPQLLAAGLKDVLSHVNVKKP